jgi:hypothetical protein
LHIREARYYRPKLQDLREPVKCALGFLGKLYSIFRFSKTIVHLTSHPQRFAQRTQLMATRGVLVENQRGATIDYHGKPITVVLQDVVRDPRAGH